MSLRAVTRRYRRQYAGRHQQPGIAPADHLLSPAAYQLVTSTAAAVPAGLVGGAR